MQIRTLALISTIFAAGMLAACGAGGSSGGGGPVITPPTNAPGGGGPDPNGYIRASIGFVNSIGAPLQENLNPGDVGQGGGSQTQSRTFAQTNNTCSQPYGPHSNTSVFFVSPATNQPTNKNSSELIRYDSPNCAAGTIVADTIRTWTPNVASPDQEAVQFTIKKWQNGGNGTTSPDASRSGVIQYAHAAGYYAFGEPIFQQHTTRTETSTVTIGGSIVTQGANEWIDGGPKDPTDLTKGEVFCGDSTGFNVVGDTALNETFGWSTQTDGSNGLRVTNGSQVVFTENRVGTALVGPIGSMSLKQSAPNTTCPIGTPAFTTAVTGGYQQTGVTIPAKYVFSNGFLSNLSISGASLSGFTVNATTTAPNRASSQPLIQGDILTGGGTHIAHFLINLNGFGSLQMDSGQIYTITDWHIVD